MVLWGMKWLQYHLSMTMNFSNKFWTLLGSGLALFSESTIYFFIIFSASKQASPWILTAISFATMLPSIFLAPMLGWFIDKLPVKFLWVISIVFSAVLSLLMGIFENYYLWIILLALQTMFSVVVGSALFKALPKIPGFNDKTASAYVVGLNSVLAIITPPIASLVFSSIGSISLLFSAFLLLVSSAIISLKVPSLQESVSMERTHLKEIIFGLESLKNLSLLKMYIPIMFAVVLFTTIEDLSGIIYIQEIGTKFFDNINFLNIDPGPLGYSVVVSMWALGSLLTSIALGKDWVNIDSVRSLMYGGILVCFAIFIEGISSSLIIVALVFIIGGIGNSVHNIGVRDIIYENVPENKQGRVWTFMGASFTIFTAIGKFIGTPYFMGEPRWVIVGSGLCGLALIISFVFFLKIKQAILKS